MPADGDIRWLDSLYALQNHTEARRECAANASCHPQSSIWHRVKSAAAASRRGFSAWFARHSVRISSVQAVMQKLCAVKRVGALKLRIEAESVCWGQDGRALRLHGLSSGFFSSYGCRDDICKSFNSTSGRLRFWLELRRSRSPENFLNGA